MLCSPAHENPPSVLGGDIHGPFVVTAFMRSPKCRPDESGHYEPWRIIRVGLHQGPFLPTPTGTTPTADPGLTV